MPTTPLRRPSCRRSGRRDVAEWLNRDPIGEEGGINLYAFVANSPAQLFDILGLRGQSVHSRPQFHGRPTYIPPVEVPLGPAETLYGPAVQTRNYEPGHFHFAHPPHHPLPSQPSTSPFWPPKCECKPERCFGHLWSTYPPQRPPVDPANRYPFQFPDFNPSTGAGFPIISVSRPPMTRPPDPGNLCSTCPYNRPPVIVIRH